MAMIHHPIRPSDGISVLSGEADVRHYPDFLSVAGADAWEETVNVAVAFEQHKYRYGNSWPRGTAWYSPHAYRYGDNTLPPAYWPEALLPLRHLVEEAAGTQFNSVLCNRYRTGRDWMSWHSDDDYPALHMTIASLSFGATRAMEFGRTGSDSREPDEVEESVALAHGSLLIMRGIATQECYLHRIPKDPVADCGERFNLTFRHLAGPNVGTRQKKRG